MSPSQEEKINKLKQKTAIDSLWRKGIIHWKLDKNQQEMYKFCEETPHTVIVIASSRQLGKTFFLCTYALQKCLQNPNYTIKYVAPKVKEIKSVVANTIREITQDCPKELRPKFRTQENTFVFPNGSVIQLAAAENGHIDGIRGTKAHLCIVDEAGFCSDLNYAIDSVLIPTTTTTGGKIIVASTPARSPDHEFVGIMRTAEDEQRLIRKTIYDNPRLTAEQIEKLAASCGGKETTQFRREYLAENIIDEKDAVVPEFTKELQEKVVVPWQKPSHFDSYVAMDIGFKDKTAVLFAYVDFQNAKLIIEDEYIISGEKMVSDTLALAIKNKEESLWRNPLTGEVKNPFLRIADNNNPILLNDLQIRHQLTFLATQKDNKEAAINNMRLLLKNEQIIINPRCTSLINHLKGAIWSKNRKDYVRTVEQGHYDMVDALVYLCRNINFSRNPFPPGYGFGGKQDVFYVEQPKASNDLERAIQNSFKVPISPKKTRVLALTYNIRENLMSTDSDPIYFAAKSGEETAQILLHKANMWYNQLYNNGYLAKLQDMWLSYYGAYYTSTSGGHKITFGGEQGELVNLAVNHLRNIATHILTMITSNRPSMEAQATNSDYKSLTQTRVANNLLEYYMRQKRLEYHLNVAVEMAIIFGSGFIKMDWNATTGEIYEYNEETNTPIYEGDVVFSNLSPFDVVFDSTKENNDNDWLVGRTFKNKYDLAAKYPEQADRIKGLKTKSDLQRYRIDMMSFDETDDVPVYEFYHKRTESMPDGRYLLFLDTDIVLMDTPLPYREIPIYRISAGNIMGTPYGYTPMFDLLPIQDAVNALYSTILTNQHAFGVQNIYIPRGADVSMKSLEGGLNIIEGNAQAGKPEAMNLTATPKEVFDYLHMLETAMETISGVNSVARGNPEASLKSGTALALVQSMALQFISGLQQQYVHLIEDVGTGLINLLKDFAAVPRIAMIAGKSNKAYVQHEFTGDDLSEVNRVVVSVGNPLAQTTAGKVQMASELVQYGVISDPKDYLTVLETGRLDVLTDGAEQELLSIRGENDRLSEGKPVRALAIDDHVTHIKHHKSILSDPDMRMDDQLSQAVLNHIQEHIDLLRTTDPGLLGVLGQQPLPPLGGSQPSPQNMQGPQPNNSQQPQAAPEAPPPGPEAANMPSLPSVSGQLLPNPQLQQQSMGNVAPGPQSQG